MRMHVAKNLLHILKEEQNWVNQNGHIWVTNQIVAFQTIWQFLALNIGAKRS